MPNPAQTQPAHPPDPFKRLGVGWASCACEAGGGSWLDDWSRWAEACTGEGGVEGAEEVWACGPQGGRWLSDGCRRGGRWWEGSEGGGGGEVVADKVGSGKGGLAGGWVGGWGAGAGGGGRAGRGVVGWGGVGWGGRVGRGVVGMGWEQNQWSLWGRGPMVSNSVQLVCARREGAQGTAAVG